jgi:hypothetical protein
MHTQRASSHHGEGLTRRALPQRGLAAGLLMSALRPSRPATLWGVEAGQPKRGGILRVRGYGPVHFDHHPTSKAKANTGRRGEGSRWVSFHSPGAWEGETCHP